MFLALLEDVHRHEVRTHLDQILNVALKDVDVLFVDAVSDCPDLPSDVLEAFGMLDARAGYQRSILNPLLLVNERDRELAMAVIPFTISAEGWSFKRNEILGLRSLGAEDSGRILWWVIRESSALEGRPWARYLNVVVDQKVSNVDRYAERVMRWSRQRALDKARDRS